MGHWNLYDAESGSELTAGYQATDEQAARMAQRRANELGRAVELCEYGSTDDGNVFEPIPKEQS